MEERNKINTYTCHFNHVLVTRDIAEGTTPMYLKCPACSGHSKSAFYSCDQTLQPTHEWYKAKYPERYKNPGIRQHCEAGGLVFRAIGAPDETESMKPLKQSERLSASLFSRLTNRKN